MTGRYQCRDDKGKHAALERARADNWPDNLVWICLDDPKCDNPEPSEGMCEDCVVIRADDKRSSRQILKEMRRVN